ncbi:MAG TPA: hypothetical protein VMZ00_09270 [Sporichthya sp.]|nr:hypothetical protein [Sporichthya sp.]
MPATPIASVARYWSVGVNKWIWCPTVANKAAPTRLEINAGTDLTGEVAGKEGWTTQSEQIEAPDANSRFKPKIPGAITAEDSSLTYYASPTGVDARSVMPRDSTGFMLRMGGGDVAGRKMDVFPCTVSAISKEFGGTEEDPAQVTISYSITSEPAEDVTIPA